MMRRCVVALAVLVSSSPSFSAPAAPGDETLLVRQPSVARGRIAFTYAGDVWITGIDGGDARRLTVHPSVESDPYLSPDGRYVAFTGRYDGNADVFVVPADGGDPLRLTFHPGPDQAAGFTPDGSRVLFSSPRASHSRFFRLFTVPREGGFPEPLPIPMGWRGAYSPDGRRIAYTPISDAFGTWRLYRGGMTTPIWIFDFATNEIEVVPHENASDTRPFFVGPTLYFLSDRRGTMNLYAYDTRTKRLDQVTRHDDFDVKSASGDGRTIVYEQAGRLHRLDLDEGAPRALPVRVSPDIPSARPQFENALSHVRAAEISPTGARAVLEARGEILTVPAKKGDVRNLTRTPGVHDRSPAWSPDGTRIAYFSDASGEYDLYLASQDGLEPPRRVPLGEETFYHSPRWSPDSKRILFTDKRLNVHYVDVESGSRVLVDTDTYDHPIRSLDPVWSPDGKYIAYTKRQLNQLRAVFIHDVEAGRSHRVTDGMTDSTFAAWSRDGKHLFFAASTNYGLNTGWLDMSSYERPVKRALYCVVLAKDAPSPLAPESDEEKKKDEAKPEGEKDEKKDATVAVEIDFEGIDQRIVSLPVPEGNHSNLQSAADGKLFYLSAEPGASIFAASRFDLKRFDMKERKSEDYLTGLLDYRVSADGKKVLVVSAPPGGGGGGSPFARRAPASIAIVDAGGSPKPGEGALSLDSMQIRIDPRAEWRQIFDEAWRIERDYFYDPHMHGCDWAAMKEKYAPFVEHVGHREDLNSLLGMLIGEMVVGHNYVGGGDQPSEDATPVGLLGADLSVENGRYRIGKIYGGLNFDPGLRAPLTEPGVRASEGDYLLSVDGRDLVPPGNPYALFVGTAGKQTVLRLAADPSGEGVWTTTVVPIPDETALRTRAWIEANRKRVDELSGGRIAYVYMPNTAEAGYTSFNRYYFAGLDKEGVVIDERFNGGGSVADYVIDLLDRPLLSWWATREGKPFATPNGSIFGPKAMIINEYAGSGGDAMPHFFRRRGLGKLVGKRTWGGLVGIYDYPPLIDGGFLTAPRLAIFSPDGRWEVENEGVPPDVEVEMTPKLVIEGRDPQLEKAVEIVLAELAKRPVTRPKLPAYPDRAQ